jgi:type IV secretion system protein VirB10
MSDVVNPEINDDGGDDAPIVRARSSRWTAPLGIIGAVALGGLVFLQLSAGRVRAENASAPVSAPEPAPALVAAPSAPAPPPPQPRATFSADAQVRANEAAARLQAPAMIVDLSEAQAPAEAGAPQNSQAIADAIGQGLSPDERFVARLAGRSDAAHARALARPDATIAQGAIIAGVLETAINSDLPGYVRALVTRDVRSFDGTRVLAPRGSRLIGQYRSALSLGQSRAFIIWTRLIRPDGVSIDLNSPAADALGRGGLEGETDTHFMQRFGGAILLSLIGVAADAAAAGNDTQVVIGVSRGSESAASAALSEEINIPPTIRVVQGSPIRIFVARDLDFSTTDAPGVVR